MMFGYLSMEFLDSLKEGDAFFVFHCRQYRPGDSEGWDIDGEDWFEPGHNPHPRNYAEAAKELYRLRDRYLPEFPRLKMIMDRKKAMAALTLPLVGGGFIILGFQGCLLNGPTYAKLRAQIEAGKEQGGQTPPAS